MKSSSSIGTLVSRRFLILAILLSVLNYSTLSAQTDLSFTDTSNATIQALATSTVPCGWMLVDKSQNVNVSTFFTATGRSSAFGLSSNDVMTEVRRDTFGKKTVTRFQQYFKGIEVGHAQFSLHTYWDTLYLAHGYIQEDLALDTAGMLSEADALDIALDSISEFLYDSATSSYPIYAWKVKSWEDSLKVDLDDTSATHYPEGELTIMKFPDKWQPLADNQLVWTFTVVSATPMVNLKIQVDALADTIILMGTHGRTCFFGKTAKSAMDVIEIKSRTIAETRDNNS